MKQEFPLIIPGRANACTLRALVFVALVLLTSAALAEQFYNLTDLVTVRKSTLARPLRSVTPKITRGFQ